ncbi:MAG: sigma-70 family RNA polymerase sigma factor [Planctomycetota bacterium]|jgi:RNA polymerase primary sigma factor|nr:sigma-70 family RNA polymerase sigma factor [Planctomycetota bacterium]
MRDDDDLHEYMNTLADLPPLSEAEEVAVVEKMARGDAAARELLILRNLRLVVSLAKKFPTHDLSFLELIYEGNYGLIKAVDRFRLGKNTRFATYATRWITQSVGQAIKERRRRIHVSHEMFRTTAAWRRARRDLTRELEREPTTDEIAARLDLPADKILPTLDALAALRGTSSEESIDWQPRADGQNEPLARMMSGGESGVDRLGPADERKFRILLECLNERSALVLRLRLGLDGRKNLTLAEVAEKMPGRAHTRERVRQLECDALAEILRILRESN